jgi:BNR repeat-like domain
VGLVALAGGAVQQSTAAPSAARLDAQQVARSLLEHGRSAYLTAPVLRAMQAKAGLVPGGFPERAPDRDQARTLATRALAAPTRAGVRNVRVNDPSADRFQPDQTTQSETTIAVVGSKVAVGFNDTQQGLLMFTNGTDITGYGYSTDGGRTFTDGGTLPNLPNFANIGDPWMTHDRGGRMYYSTLALGGNQGSVEVGVSWSDNGGRSWTTPRLASPNSNNLSYFADKDAVTAGPDPKVRSRDNVYAVWDDSSFDFGSGAFAQGLAVARSTDRGKDWELRYADRAFSDPDSCSFRQYQGAQPLVDPANGVLYVAAERAVVTDPSCNGGTVSVQEVLFKSKDGGRTFGPATTIADVTQVGGLDLGQGRVVRTAEFPVLTLHGGRLWAAWNALVGGRSHIMLAWSTNGGTNWSTSIATSGTTDEIQPALASDGNGVHLAYYQRNGNDSFDLVASDTVDGFHFRSTRITSTSFPVVVTVPQFDPVVAFGYMGDYVSVVSDGKSQYFAWGDNRDRVTNFLHPQGRHDPDVFFARR